MFEQTYEFDEDLRAQPMAKGLTSYFPINVLVIEKQSCLLHYHHLSNDIYSTRSRVRNPTNKAAYFWAHIELKS